MDQEYHLGVERFTGRPTGHPRVTEKPVLNQMCESSVSSQYAIVRYFGFLTFRLRVYPIEKAAAATNYSEIQHRRRTRNLTDPV